MTSPDKALEVKRAVISINDRGVQRNHLTGAFGAQIILAPSISALDADIRPGPIMGDGFDDVGRLRANVHENNCSCGQKSFLEHVIPVLPSLSLRRLEASVHWPPRAR